MKKSEYFINEFVIGLGFLSGLWTAVGIDPEDEIFRAFSTIRLMGVIYSDSSFIQIL